MELISINDTSCKYIIAPNGQDFYIRMMCMDGENVPSEGICAFLNQIADQGITCVDVKNCKYTIGEKVLPISYMSTGELIFLFAYIADYTKTKIGIYRYTSQLSLKSIRLLLNAYYDSPYVNIVEKDAGGFFLGEYAYAKDHCGK